MPSKRRPRRAPEAAERKRDPDRTKRRILDAAIDAFARKGYAGARVADIAAAAGVNQQLISYYFGGKAGLAKAIGRLWRSYEAALLLILLSAGTAPAVYPQLVRGLCGVAADAPDFVEHYTAQLARVVRALHKGHGG